MCFLILLSDTTPFTDLVGDRIVSVYSLRQKGDIIRKKTGQVADSFRVSITVSDAEWDSFPKQTKDAITFLEKHSNYIKETLDSHKATDAYLDFPLYSRLGGPKNIANQNDLLPKDLIKLAGHIGIGINMSIYEKDDLDDVLDQANDG